MTDSEINRLLQSIHDLETKLTAVIAANHATVMASFAAMTEVHHKAMLDQERTNSTFATRKEYHDQANSIQKNYVRIAELEARIKGLEEDDQRGQNNLAENIRSGFGWIIVGTCAILGPVLAWALSHIH